MWHSLPSSPTTCIRKNLVLQYHGKTLMIDNFNSKHFEKGDERNMG
ncbi:predicted protein [Botrytis cinerea T4]|uniref:Uncharacterized protein n=1 Tax=Botryotinia fuckeliana (strain T4) TaxID=999810 RepID=G2XMZ0_BOTF4|nr:predicted protein [Botrytis cinerea T4]